MASMRAAVKRSVPVFGLVAVALVILATSAPGTGLQGRQGQQAEEPQPGPNQIIVVLTCNEQQGGGIRVNPFRRVLESTDTATWRRVGNYTGPYTIDPVGFFPWTLSNDGTSDDSGEVVGTPPEGGAPGGTFHYAVRFTCNGDEVVLDPRMEVPR